MFKCPFLVSSWLPGEASEKNNGNAQKKKPFKTCVACVTFYLDCYQNRCSSFCSAIPHFLPSILQPYLLGVKEFVLKYEFVENIFFFFFFCPFCVTVHDPPSCLVPYLQSHFVSALWAPSRLTAAPEEDLRRDEKSC